VSVTPPSIVKVLIVDDSRVARDLLQHVLGGAPGIEVIGAVSDGQSGLDFLARADPRPDVVVMDIHMPKLDGFETTRRIMESQPLPIIICTATADPQELAIAFRSMEAGAVACIEKPVSPARDDFEARAANLIQNVRLMSEVKVVRRWPRPRQLPAATPSPSATNGSGATIRCVGIGASTGGPPVLQTILSGLPKDFPAPILIVQHIARGFLHGFVEWLNQTTGLCVHVAAHGTLALPGHAYIAPDDFHLGAGAGGRILLSRDPPENGLRPAVSHLFRSMARTWGANAVGALLTGMGKDGAVELKQMKDAGAITIAQDRESSVVHGMPGEAIALGAATLILPADHIAGALISQVKRKAASAGGLEPWAAP
jgi:two-component system chemotaxis response regulator CheB